MRPGKKKRARNTARVNAWMASPKMQKDTGAFKRPGSMK